MKGILILAAAAILHALDQRLDASWIAKLAQRVGCRAGDVVVFFFQQVNKCRPRIRVVQFT